jgi:hypothetical protein
MSKYSRREREILIWSAIVYVVVIGVSIYFLKWWAFAVFLVTWWVIWKLSIRYYTRLRDNADFTTVRGKELIKICNRRLNSLRGYGSHNT